MPRPVRDQPPGFFHVVSRGVDGRPVFDGDETRLMYLHLVARTVRTRGVKCHRYCLMDNHVHLVLETVEDGQLASALQLLNSRYACAFNQIVGRRGYLFERPYTSRRLVGETHTLECCRYVDLNPVRARMRERALDYPWSSYRATVGLSPAPPFLATDWTLGLFDDDASRARTKYAIFVEEGARRPRPPDMY
jgi:putative transposase